MTSGDFNRMHQASTWAIRPRLETGWYVLLLWLEANWLRLLGTLTLVLVAIGVLIGLHYSVSTPDAQVVVLFMALMLPAIWTLTTVLYRVPEMLGLRDHAWTKVVRFWLWYIVQVGVTVTFYAAAGGLLRFYDFMTTAGRPNLYVNPQVAIMAANLGVVMGICLGLVAMFSNIKRYGRTVSIETSRERQLRRENERLAAENSRLDGEVYRQSGIIADREESIAALTDQPRSSMW